MKEKIKKTQEIKLKINLKEEKKKRKKLSPREGEVLKYLEEGFLIKEVAAKLKISQKTVCAYLTNVYNKFEVSNVRELLFLLKKDKENSKNKQFELLKKSCNSFQIPFSFLIEMKRKYMKEQLNLIENLEIAEYSECLNQKIRDYEIKIQTVNDILRIYKKNEEK